MFGIRSKVALGWSLMTFGGIVFFAGIVTAFYADALTIDPLAFFLMFNGLTLARRIDDDLFWARNLAIWYTAILSLIAALSIAAIWWPGLLHFNRQDFPLGELGWTLRLIIAGALVWSIVNLRSVLAFRKADRPEAAPTAEAG